MRLSGRVLERAEQAEQTDVKPVESSKPSGERFWRRAARRAVEAPGKLVRKAVENPKTTAAVLTTVFAGVAALPTQAQEGGTGTPDAITEIVPGSWYAEVTGANNVNIRSGESTNSEVVGQLPEGTGLILGPTSASGWAEVLNVYSGATPPPIVDALNSGKAIYIYAEYASASTAGATPFTTVEPVMQETPPPVETEAPQVESVLEQHPEWAEFPEVVGTKLKTMQIKVNGKPFTINWFANLGNLENFAVDFPGIMLPKDGSEAEIGAIVEVMLGSDYDPSKPLTVASFSSDEAIVAHRVSLQWPELEESGAGASDFAVRGDVINIVLTTPMAMPKGVNYNTLTKASDGRMHELPSVYFDYKISEQGSNQLVVYLAGDSLMHEEMFTNLTMVAPFGWLSEYHKLNIQCAQQFGEAACQPGSEALRRLIMTELVAGYDDQLRRPSQAMSAVILNPPVEGERTPTPTLVAAVDTFEPFTPRQ